jgi:DNA mismatch repair protein MutS
MSDKDRLTPVRRQYLEIKRQHPDSIVFFRLGDFYETFDEDAEITSRELDIVLTSRNVAKGVRIPMAGIPHHAAENYLARLVDRGYHVAICEQVGDQPVDGLVPRKVTRIITPGTVTEPGLLDAGSNNFLACVVLGDARVGFAFVEISTGDFAATEFQDGDQHTILRGELARVGPAEILIGEDIDPNLMDGLPGHVTIRPAWRFELGRSQEILLRHFEVGTLEGFGLRGAPLATRAAGAILQYIEETEPGAMRLLDRLASYQLSEFMLLDSATRRNLELTETLRERSPQGSLLGVLDQTVTPMGKRLIRQWVSKPLLNIDGIRARQAGIGFFYDDGILRGELLAALKPIADLERLTNRVVSGRVQPRDLVSLRGALERLPGLRSILPVGESPIQRSLEDYHLCDEVLSLLKTALADDPPATLQTTGSFRFGYSSELDQVIDSTQAARDWIANLESDERKRLGIKTLKVGYNKVFGYYIEISKATNVEIPQDYIRKQTLVNAERYITPELKEYEATVLNAEDRIKELEGRLFREVCQIISTSAGRLLSTARAVAELDVLGSLAEVARQRRYICPEVVEEDVLEIQEGRHPVVEIVLPAGKFISNDIRFDPAERIRILTGPNMSGKSTYLRQAALIVLMAQMGSYIPASGARIGLVDRIFTRIGAQDEIHAGQSTFMVEMIEMANILHHATDRSLLILDEVGRGTSTYDGVSIAWAVVEYLHNHPGLRSKTLFATHYHELTQLGDLLPGVTNYSEAVSEADGKVVFLHKILPGSADRSYGIHVAQLAGLPRPVIMRADEILRDLENSSGEVISINPQAPEQMALFPLTNPLLDELATLDLNTLAPIEALNKLYEWRKRYLKDQRRASQD